MAHLYIRSRQTSLLILLICLSLVAVKGFNSQAPSDVQMRERISALISETLREGEGVVDGIKVWSRVPPSTKTVEELKRYGDDAVPILAKYLDASNDSERGIAVEFLGLLGGRRIVAPLRKVIRYDASPTIRILALRWITKAPWDLAAPVVREAAETDHDEKVRVEARQLLANRAKAQRSDQHGSGQEVNQLIAVIRDKRLRERDPTRVVQAINRLGEIRATRAIDDLIFLLTFKRTFEWESQSKEVINEIQPITPGNRYPATSALAQIGEPALRRWSKLLHLTNLIRSKARTQPTQSSQYFERIQQREANT